MRRRKEEGGVVIIVVVDFFLFFYIPFSRCFLPFFLSSFPFLDLSAKNYTSPCTVRCNSNPIRYDAISSPLSPIRYAGPAQPATQKVNQ